MKVVLNIPNAITTLRVLLTIPLVIFILQGNQVAALITFFIGLFSDMDGTVARVLKQVTEFGAFYDVAADAMFTGGGLIALLMMSKVSFVLLLLLILVNGVRWYTSLLALHKYNTFGSTFLSKTTGVLTALIIPIGILGFFVDLYVAAVIVLTAIVMGIKTYRLSK